jgi:glucan biosynthesis protein C
MTASTAQKQERQYYIDWLRILLIISVFLFHVGMIFNTWTWHIKNNVQFGGILKQTMDFLHLWRMPLLFMVSGAGTYFALGKRTPFQYLTERFRRLFIPLVAGIFILVPVQVYIEKISQFKSLTDFYSQMFDGVYPEGNFSWHHLWFIAYLFFISLIISPFLNYLRSDRFARLIPKIERTVTRPLALNICVIPLLLSQFLLRPFFETGTNDFIHDWASMTYYLLYFLMGYILIPVGSITESMNRYRYWYLTEVFIFAVLLFILPVIAGPEFNDSLIHEILAILLAWSCALTAIGFAKHNLNRDSKQRKFANEAIYPFYLLHQPVIVVVGFFVVQSEIPALLKAGIIGFSSFTIIVLIYGLLIRPFNLLRLVFGMKKKIIVNERSVVSRILQPIVAKGSDYNIGK